MNETEEEVERMEMHVFWGEIMSGIPCLVSSMQS